MSEPPADSFIYAAASDLTACRDCDTLYRIPSLGEGEAAECERCGATLLVNTRNGLHRSAAFAVSASTLFVIANAFPFMSLTAAGRTNTVNLFDSILQLWNYRDPWLAAAVFAFIIGLPLLICLCQMYVLLPLVFGKVAIGSRLVCRFAQQSIPWSMVEVFFLGVIVSLLKLVKLADVGFEIGFWAFAALIACLTASLISIDKRELWKLLNPHSS